MTDGIGEQIGGDGFDAALAYDLVFVSLYSPLCNDGDGVGAEEGEWTDNGTVSFGRVVVLAYHFEDPWRLARHVDIVRAVGGAGLYDWAGIQAVGTDGVD